MKATGIIRRIDDLSRIVIPKEIRKPCISEKAILGDIYREGRRYHFKEIFPDR